MFILSVTSSTGTFKCFTAQMINERTLKSCDENILKSRIEKFDNYKIFEQIFLYLFISNAIKQRNSQNFLKLL